MPRVHVRKARKDYPAQGIKKGDTYYYTKLKLQRGGMVKRSLKPFKQSELTNSSFKSGWLAAQEDWDESGKTGEDATSAAEAIREVGNEAQESFDNMPEGLQQGDTGQQLENRAQECERIADEIDGYASTLDDLEEPEEPEGGEPDDDEAEDFHEKTDAWETYQDELTQYESEIEEAKQAIDDLLNEMPE